jgi:hypothetical protein
MAPTPPPFTRSLQDISKDLADEDYFAVSKDKVLDLPQRANSSNWSSSCLEQLHSMSGRDMEGRVQGIFGGSL